MFDFSCHHPHLRVEREPDKVHEAVERDLVLCPGLDGGSASRRLGEQGAPLWTEGAAFAGGLGVKRRYIFWYNFVHFSPGSSELERNDKVTQLHPPSFT